MVTWRFACHPGKEILLRPGPVAFLGGELVGGARAEDAEILRQHDELRSVLDRGAHEQPGLREVFRNVASRDRLDRRHPHSLAHFAPASFPDAGEACAALPNPPTRSTTGSTHDPVTR